jgi:hypothetical protein
MNEERSDFVEETGIGPAAGGARPGSINDLLGISDFALKPDKGKSAPLTTGPISSLGKIGKNENHQRLPTD